MEAGEATRAEQRTGRADFQATSDPAVQEAADRGQATLLSYKELYALWERQQWRTQDIDFSRDREDWHQRFDGEDRFQRMYRLAAAPDDGEAMVEAITLYHMVIEGMLALTGQHFIIDYNESQGTLPGFVEGFNNIARDEHRHVAFGSVFLREKAQEDDRYKAAIQRVLEQSAPVAAQVLSPPWVEHEENWELFGISRDETRQFAATTGSVAAFTGWASAGLVTVTACLADPAPAALVSASRIVTTGGGATGAAATRLGAGDPWSGATTLSFTSTAPAVITAAVTTL